MNTNFSDKHTFPRDIAKSARSTNRFNADGNLDELSQKDIDASKSEKNNAELDDILEGAIKEDNNSMRNIAEMMWNHNKIDLLYSMLEASKILSNEKPATRLAEKKLALDATPETISSLLNINIDEFNNFKEKFKNDIRDITEIKDQKTLALLLKFYNHEDICGEKQVLAVKKYLKEKFFTEAKYVKVLSFQHFEDINSVDDIILQITDKNDKEDYVIFNILSGETSKNYDIDGAKAEWNKNEL
jgi:hypothetical protein